MNDKDFRNGSPYFFALIYVTGVRYYHVFKKNFDLPLVKIMN